MIKVNVVLNNISWKKYLKNPNKFVAKKINLLNKNNKNYKKNIFIVSILLSGAKEIKKLNKKFRNNNKSTDILSFPFYSKSILKKKIKQEKEIYLGDIIINLGKIKNKNDLKKFKNEFNKLWVHGLVHLFGYKHKKDQEFNKMNNIEKQYLRLIN
jgi:probable rRNA maturation factor